MRDVMMHLDSSCGVSRLQREHAERRACLDRGAVSRVRHAVLPGTQLLTLCGVQRKTGHGNTQSKLSGTFASCRPLRRLGCDEPGSGFSAC